MTKDRVKGRAKQAGGKVKEVTGRATGKPGMELRGKAKKTEGRVQAGYGDAKSNFRKENRT